MFYRLFCSIGLLSVLIFSPVTAAQVFERTTESAGFNSTLKPVFANPIWGDMNGDGFIDLMVSHHGTTPDIYINSKDGTFSERHVIPTFGIEYFSEHYDFHGYSFTDFNSDGVLDLFITLGAKRGDPEFSKRDLLYRGNGNGSFEQVSTEFGVENPTGRGRSSCWFDYDGDGQLDFFLKNLDTPNLFFLNQGESGFVDIAADINLQGFTLGSVCSIVDYDNDGDMDIFLTSGSLDDTLLSQLEDGSFVDASELAGIAPYARGHGVAWGDYNNDGFMDLYIARGAPSSFTGLISELELENTLYTNNGDGSFTEDTLSAGLSGNYNTSAAVWGDVNNDGLLDLLVTNAGEVDGSGNHNFLYLNNGDGTFTDIADQANINDQAEVDGHRYHTTSMGDYDNDGALDIILASESIGSSKGATELYRNLGNSNAYLKVVLKGVRGNKLGIGSLVTVDSENLQQVKQYTGATNGVYFSQSQQPLHFGLGQSVGAGIEVVWPKGARVSQQVVNNVAVNQTVVIEEGRSIVRGRPAIFKEESVCNVWRNNQGWNLRCIGSDVDKIHITGQITSNGDFTSVTPVRLEPNDSLSYDAETIVFDLYAKQGHDTITFNTTGNEASYDIFIDGVHQPDAIRIGEYEVIPASLPVVLAE